MFTNAVLSIEEELHAIAVRHRALRVSILAYLKESRPASILSIPIIYIGLAPFAVLDLFLWMYQATCFPLYGIPKVKRSRYIIYDRSKLRYLNAIEKLHCRYCSYANGLAAYFVEVAARTEQYWCPIKHRIQSIPPHSRYGRFFDYGDASAYRGHLEQVRDNFDDLKDRERRVL